MGGRSRRHRDLILLWRQEEGALAVEEERQIREQARRNRSGMRMLTYIHHSQLRLLSCSLGRDNRLGHIRVDWAAVEAQLAPATDAWLGAGKRGHWTELVSARDQREHVQEERTTPG